MNRANDMHAKQSVKSYITYSIFRTNSFLKMDMKRNIKMKVELYRPLKRWVAEEFDGKVSSSSWLEEHSPRHESHSSSH